MSVRVKICGVTTVNDALVCAEAGADAIGLNFWSRSPRSIDLERAAEISRVLPAGVMKVGVFVDAARDAILRAIEAASLDAIQLHGDARHERRDTWRVHVRERVDGVGLRRRERDRDRELLDAEPGEDPEYVWPVVIEIRWRGFRRPRARGFRAPARCRSPSALR